MLNASALVSGHTTCSNYPEEKLNMVRHVDAGDNLPGPGMLEAEYFRPGVELSGRVCLSNFTMGRSCRPCLPCCTRLGTFFTVCEITGPVISTP